MASKERKYKIVHISNKLRVLPDGDFLVPVVIEERGGKRHNHHYDVGYQDFGGWWTTAPRYLRTEVREWLCAAHFAGELVFWELTYDGLGGERYTDLLYFNADFWVQLLGLADSIFANREG